MCIYRLDMSVCIQIIFSIYIVKSSRTKCVAFHICLINCSDSFPTIVQNMQTFSMLLSYYKYNSVCCACKCVCVCVCKCSTIEFYICMLLQNSR